MNKRIDFHKPEWAEAHAGFGFSQAVKVGNTLYLSGTTSCGEGFVPEHVGDFRAQFTATYSKIRETLAHFGLGMNDIVKETMFTKDMAALVANMDVRKSFYGDGPYPASTGIAINELFFLELLVEVEVIAVDPAADGGKER